MLDLIDDVAARAERFVPMRGADADPDGAVAKLQRTHPMHAGGAGDAEALAGFSQNAFTFTHRQRFERLVLETAHCLAFVVIAYPAFESRVATAIGISEGALQFRDIERGVAEAKTHGHRLNHRRPAE